MNCRRQKKKEVWLLSLCWYLSVNISSKEIKKKEMSSMKFTTKHIFQCFAWLQPCNLKVRYNYETTFSHFFVEWGEEVFTLRVQYETCCWLAFNSGSTCSPQRVCSDTACLPSDKWKLPPGCRPCWHNAHNVPRLTQKHRTHPLLCKVRRCKYTVSFHLSSIVLYWL